MAERSLGEFFLGSLRLHHQAAVVAAVLRPDEERNQARQDHALEQVVALHGGEHACRVLSREDLAAEAVAPADERSDALGGQQREAHPPHRDRAVLRAPGAVGPRQPEGRVGDDLRDLHAQLAQHRKGTLHVAGDRVIVAGSHLIAVDLHAEALIARPGREQRAIAGGGVERRQAPKRVDRLLDERCDLGRRVELLQPPHVTEAGGGEHAAGGIERFIRQRTAEQLAALAPLDRSCDCNRSRHGPSFRNGPTPCEADAARAARPTGVQKWRGHGRTREVRLPIRSWGTDGRARGNAVYLRPVPTPAFGDLQDPRCTGVRTSFQPVRGAYDAGESRLVIRGAGNAARGDQHALAIAGGCFVNPRVCPAGLRSFWVWLRTSSSVIVSGCC